MLPPLHLVLSGAGSRPGRQTHAPEVAAAIALLLRKERRVSLTHDKYFISGGGSELKLQFYPLAGRFKKTKQGWRTQRNRDKISR